MPNNDSSVVVAKRHSYKAVAWASPRVINPEQHVTMKHHLYIGIDRSDTSIDICSLDNSGESPVHTKISSAPESLLPWVRELEKSLSQNQTIALCIEQPCQNLIHFFSQFAFLCLYLVNPAVIKKYRESLSASRAKDDRRDAHTLALFIFERHARLQPWIPVDPLAEQISLLTEKRRQLIGIRTSLTNKLTQALKDTYPQALELTGRDLHAPLARAFLTKWPTLQALQKAKSATVTQFYYTHGSRRPKVIEQRIELIHKAVPLCTEETILAVYTELILALVRQIAAVQTSILHFDAMIEERTAKHQDAHLFKSLPGAGAAFSARLLAFFGSDREKYQSAAAVQKDSGVAPLTKQSGKMNFVHRRYACNKFWRQTFVEWAAQTVIKSLWAKAYYQQQKAKGHRHQSILRGLAYKWQRILFRCWQNRETYNEDRYIEALQRSSSPLISLILEMKKINSKPCEQNP